MDLFQIAQVVWMDSLRDGCATPSVKGNPFHMAQGVRLQNKAQGFSSVQV